MVQDAWGNIWQIATYRVETRTDARIDSLI